MWVFHHPDSHELGEICNSLDGHGVVHRDSNAWVEEVSLNLNNACLSSIIDELLLHLGVAAADSEDHVDSGANAFVCNLRFIIVSASFKEVPQHLTSLIGQKLIVVKASHLIHIRAVETSNVHRIDARGVVIGVWGFFEFVPICENWSIRLLFTEQVFSNNHNGTSSCSEVLLGSHIHDSNLAIFPRNVAGSDIRAHVHANRNVFRNLVPWESF